MKPETSKGRTIFESVALFVVTLLVTLGVSLFFRLAPELRRPIHLPLAFHRFLPPIELVALPTAARFDFPIGNENGAFAYNAQPFTQNRHLGDDLNGIGGENSDLGDPVYAVADGRVLLAREGGPGWGNVVIVLHAYREAGERRFLQSYYAHLDKILVAPRQSVRRGDQIGTVGTGGGRYLAHLHFEMRAFTAPFIGPGYRADTRGWINPGEFISCHRGAPEDDVGRMNR